MYGEALFFILFSASLASTGQGVDPAKFKQCSKNVVDFTDCIRALPKPKVIEVNEKVENATRACFDRGPCNAPDFTKPLESHLNEYEQKTWKKFREWYDTLTPKQRKCGIDALATLKGDWLDVCLQETTGIKITSTEDVSITPQFAGTPEEVEKVLKYRTSIEVALENCHKDTQEVVRECVVDNRRSRSDQSDRVECEKKADVNSIGKCHKDFLEIQSLVCPCVAEKQKQVKAHLIQRINEISDGDDEKRVLDLIRACTATKPEFIKEKSGKDQVEKPWSRDLNILGASYDFADIENFQIRFCAPILATPAKPPK